MIELDGSMGEGGGQILRSSLALSLLTGQPFRLRKIRARRSKPGLQAQHLMSVQAAAAIGAATVTGAHLGSIDLTFRHGAVKAGDYHFRIGTAGATGLVLHTVYLPLALAAGSSTVTIDGGTHVTHSPCFHFLDVTWRGYLALMGLQVDLTMVRPGFYPRGGGQIQAVIPGSATLKGLDLTVERMPDAVTGFSAVAGLPASIAQRQSDRVRKRLEKAGHEVEIREESWPGGPGTVVGLTIATKPAPTFFFALGERGKPAERVADEAADQVIGFLAILEPGMDAHSADQVLLPLALAEGPSRYQVRQVTQHLLTNAMVLSQFLSRRIVVEGEAGGPGRVQID